MYTHSSRDCEGHPCVVHSPSEHHMRGWPLLWRGDRTLVERVCEHGVGHPDPDDLAYRIGLGRQSPGTHGCDGCCQVIDVAEKATLIEL